MSRARQLRQVDGFEAAAAEVVRRCAPGAFRHLIRQAGAWIPSPSLKVVTPALLYNMAVGLDRNGWNLNLDEREREERANNVIPIKRNGLSMADLRAWCEEQGGTPWLHPSGLDGLTVGGRPQYPDGTGRYGFEPTLAEFRAGLFGMGEGSS